MKWLRNALRVLILHIVREELAAQRTAESDHVGELTAAMHKILDELNRALAREAMRKARAAEKATKPEPETVQTEAAAIADAEGAPLTPKQRARARWQQLRAQGER